LEAASAELTVRWAKAFHTEKTKANQLRRIVALWNLHHDPAGIRPERHTPKHRAGLAQRVEDRRTKAAVTRIANRRAAIRERRRIPDSFALQVKQASTVVVVPPPALAVR
jgi:hypothetical protein